jgi:hypothetical protein
MFSFLILLGFQLISMRSLTCLLLWLVLPLLAVGSTFGLEEYAFWLKFLSGSVGTKEWYFKNLSPTIELLITKFLKLFSIMHLFFTTKNNLIRIEKVLLSSRFTLSMAYGETVGVS